MGFGFAAVFLLLAKPSWWTMLASLLLVAPGLWLRGYASGYVRKNAELTTTGPYAHTRNPLYLGSMLIAFGFAAAAASWVVLISLAALFAAIYIPTIQSEEEYLSAHFAGFDAYSQEVPRLLPRVPRLLQRQTSVPSATAADGERGEFSAALYRKHREYNSMMGAGAIYAALALKLVYSLHPSILGFSRLPWRP